MIPQIKEKRTKYLNMSRKRLRTELRPRFPPRRMWRTRCSLLTKRGMLLLWLVTKISKLRWSQGETKTGDEIWFLIHESKIIISQSARCRWSDWWKWLPHLPQPRCERLIFPQHFIIIHSTGAYELRSGSADVAIEYLDQAIRSEPEDELLFIMRCKCLIK